MHGQGLHQELRQRQTQQLVLAPQLRQSLKILQVAALDLRATIQEELQNNPALEELPMDGESLNGSDGTDDPSDADPREELDFSKDFEILSKLDQDWRDYLAQAGGGQNYSPEDAERRQHFFDSLVSETSLQEHLLRQAEMLDCEPKLLAAVQYLIGSLDHRGYLSSSLQDLALYSGLPLEDLQEASRLLKTFDPPGIGARDLQECLMLQLAARGRQRSLPARIVQDQFDLLCRRRVPEIAKKLALPMDDVQQAMEEIGGLDPAPGRRFADDTNRVVIPDVTVEKDGDSWVVTLTSDYIPRLRISNTYKELIAKGELSREEKEYLRDKIRSGKFLINAIEQRQQTIERITREILKFQKDFFEHGISKLHPLTMTRVAETVGVHETTVSRAIANKYIKTPHGVFEFKFFFTPGYQSDAGESISNTTVKDKIATLVSDENPSHPLSDQEIVTILQENGIQIARRTVAKYREELGILPSNLRRQYA